MSYFRKVFSCFLRWIKIHFKKCSVIVLFLFFTSLLIATQRLSDNDAVLQGENREFDMRIISAKSETNSGNLLSKFSLRYEKRSQRIRQVCQQITQSEPVFVQNVSQRHVIHYRHSSLRGKN